MNRIILSATILFCHLGLAQKNNIKPVTSSVDSAFSSFIGKIPYRMIGPATTSGRIVDIAVNPSNSDEFYVAAAYGGVWKTTNHGTTFSPIFEKQGTQSIGCLKIDSKNPNIIWVGTGENNNQRSVGYGNGIYKSTNGGKSFIKMGLDKSFSIGKIEINRENSNEIWVAAYGSVWNEGGERGIYHTTDGGVTWNLDLSVSENTGFNEIHQDPFDAQILFACAHQRRRHEWTYLGGGPESAIYKSVDKGKTWNKLTEGLPNVDLGRISITISPKIKGLIYAIIEAEPLSGGIYISRDYGASWTKQNPFQTSGNYYQEIFCDPVDENRIYIMDTYLTYSNDGGKTIQKINENTKHVDNHSIWIDPLNNNHLFVGCDGGLYETFDLGNTWRFSENLPITQFYHVSVDHTKPFYNIYGGTQDNFSIGGPSRNITTNGLSNDDWFVTVGGDGFKTQIDPTNNNLVYSQWQYGGLVRFDKISGEIVDIRPIIQTSEKPLRWNWDAPLLISKYDHNVLYFAANRVFKSNNSGNSWNLISPDLSQSLDRNTIPVMGKIWDFESVAKNQSTSNYGNITAMCEGKENELLIGTDDGNLQYSDNAGTSWSKLSLVFEGFIPKKYSTKSGIVTQSINPFVSSVYISPKTGDFYVTLDNHRQGDFKPYIYVSSNKGKDWRKLGSGLPENGAIKCFFQDPLESNLLLVGTEFGCFISKDAGKSFIPFLGGLPSVPIREIVHQEDEDDLVFATFGRGFVVCDEYEKIRTYVTSNSPLKSIVARNHKVYIPYEKNGGKGNGFHGNARYTGENLSEGIKIFYFMVNIPKKMSDRRKLSIKSENSQNLKYFSKDSVVSEYLEMGTEWKACIFSTLDSLNPIAQWKVKPDGKWNITEWNCRSTIRYNVKKVNPDPIWGPFVNPGTYYFVLCQTGKNERLQVIRSNTFDLNYYFHESKDKVNSQLEERLNVMKQLNNSLLKVSAMNEKIEDLQTKLNVVTDYCQSVSIPTNDLKELNSIQTELKIIKIEMYGNTALSAREFETNSGISNRIFQISGEMNQSFFGSTKIHLNTLEYTLKELDVVIQRYNAMELSLQRIIERNDSLSLFK